MTTFRIDAEQDEAFVVGSVRRNSNHLGFNATSYEFDYFSGSQIGVYIGDLLIDDVVTIEYSVRQNKRPIYGYASQYYHTVAAGQVLVNGRFAVPFKEAAYINLALANFWHKMFMGYQLSPVDFAETGRRIDPKVLRQNIERLIADDHPAVDRFDFYKDLAALPDNAFENIAEKFQDALWKIPREYKWDTPNVNRDIAGGMDKPPDATSEDWQHYRRADQYPPFDIWILYGDVSDRSANNTIRKIFDCEIIGQSQVIQVGGEPIMEVYDFIGRNLG